MPACVCAGYSGYSHLLWLFGGCIVVFALSFMLMDPITLHDILTIPFVFVIGNAYEYGKKCEINNSNKTNFV